MAPQPMWPKRLQRPSEAAAQKLISFRSMWRPPPTCMMRSWSAAPSALTGGFQLQRRMLQRTKPCFQRVALRTSLPAGPLRAGQGGAGAHLRRTYCDTEYGHKAGRCRSNCRCAQLQKLCMAFASARAASVENAGRGKWRLPGSRCHPGLVAALL